MVRWSPPNYSSHPKLCHAQTHLPETSSPDHLPETSFPDHLPEISSPDHLPEIWKCWGTHLLGSNDRKLLLVLQSVGAHEFCCFAACRIFPDQGSNPHLLHWQADSLPLSHQGSPLRSYWYMKMPPRPKPRARLLWTGHLFLQACCLAVSTAEPERLPHHPAAGQGRELQQRRPRGRERGSHGREPRVQFQVFRQSR